MASRRSKGKSDGLITLSTAPSSLYIPKMYQDPNAAKYGFVNNSQAAQYQPGLVQPSANAGLINGMTPQNIKEREAYQQQMAAGERSMFEPPQGLVPPAVGGGLLAQPEIGRASCRERV